MVLKIAAIALIAVMSAMTVRHERPDIAVALGIAGGAAVLIAVIDGITDLTAMLTELAEKTGVGGDLISSNSHAALRKRRRCRRCRAACLLPEK